MRRRLGSLASFKWLPCALALALCAACGSSASNSAGGESGVNVCSRASVTFKLLVAPGSASTYCVATSPYTCTLGSWFSIRNAEGTYLSQDVGRCTGSCDPCTQLACLNLCTEPEAIGSDGITRTFDGSYFVPNTCGSGTSCTDGACAPPGDYVAEMCGASDADSSGPSAACQNVSNSSSRACVEVPFTWPPSASGLVLEGTIGAGSAP